MQSRWFHRPNLHFGGNGVEKKVGWLELFYDLVFVAAFIELGNALSSNVSPGGFFSFLGIFVPLWLSWTGFTFYMNRFSVDDFLHRLMVFGQMFTVAAMAVTAKAALEGDIRLFAYAYAASQLLIAAQYFRASRQVPKAREYAGYWARVFFIAAIFWIVAPWLSSPWNWIMCGIGIVEILVSPFQKKFRALSLEFPTDFEHLAERYGLLTLIVLGESFVKTIGSFSGEANWDLIFQASGVLLITCCLWWVYFDDIAGAEIREKKMDWVVWMYGHLPLQAGLVATGVAVKKAAHFDFGLPVADGYRWLLCGSLGLVFFATAIVDSVTERREAELSDRLRVNVRGVSAILMLLLAPASAGLSAGVFVAIVTALCVGQVIFDMAMAPFESSHLEEEAIPIHEGRSEGMKRRDVSETVRKGTPQDMRQDLYFYFLEGGWPRLFISVGVVFLFTNVFFGALYLLSPGCVDGVSSFSEAFFFSVQTISTIGYGAMSPLTDYGHTIVVIEAAFGILGVALTTGLVIAKASRPKSSVMFSDKLVVHDFDGVPTLSFRAANARGNEVVDAKVSVSAIIEHETQEGASFRRVEDLLLKRSETPLFVLSWNVMHFLTEESPLHGVDLTNESGELVTIVVTLSGHDGTYGQTNYARKFYYPEDVVMGARFAHISSYLPDGRLMLDYSKFHDIEPV